MLYANQMKKIVQSQFDLQMKQINAYWGILLHFFVVGGQQEKTHTDIKGQPYFPQNTTRIETNDLSCPVNYRNVGSLDQMKQLFLQIVTSVK